MSITLIQDPQYRVDLQQFAPQDVPAADQKTRGLLFVARQFFGTLATSVLCGGYQTVALAAQSFVPLTFDLLRTPDYNLQVFTVAYSAFQLGKAFIAFTALNMFRAYNQLQVESSLEQAAPQGMNWRHIQASETGVDCSQVPDTVTVDKLLDLFDRANFDDPQKPGYINPKQKTADNDIYTKEMLREHLQRLITFINKEKPHVGTPPQEDIAGLKQFYRELKEAIRFCIHAVNSKEEAFQKAHPDLDFQNLTKNERIAYCNLRENQGRLTWDLAVAGSCCGSRQMAEAIKSYEILRLGQLQQETVGESLRDLLIEVREEIAEREVATHFGGDAHGFTRYMKDVGSMLGIPATADIVEHLLDPLLPSQYLRSFFTSYTEECIIAAVQRKIKESALFRDQVIDWFKGQIGEWRPAESPSREAKIAELRSIIKEMAHLDISAERENIGLFTHCLSLQDQPLTMCGKDASFPNLDLLLWNGFIKELFALDQVKEILDKASLTNPPLEKRKKRATLALWLSTEPLASLLEQKYRAGALVATDKEICALLSALARAQKMQKVLSLPVETCLRILEGKANLEEVVTNYLTREWEANFLNALDIQNMAQVGLRPQLMEWILCAHGIFVPQVEQLTPIQLPDPLPQEKLQSYQSLIAPADGRPPGEASINQKRHPFANSSLEERRQWGIFIAQFKKEGQRAKIMRAAQGILSESFLFSPAIQVNIQINVSRLIATIARHKLFKICFVVYGLYKIWRFGRSSYERTTIWGRRLHLYAAELMKSASPELVWWCQKASTIHSWFIRYRCIAFSGALITRNVLRKQGYPDDSRVQKWMAPLEHIFSPHNYFTILLHEMNVAVKSLKRATDTISVALIVFAQRAQQEKKKIEQAYCYALWKKAEQLRSSA